MDDNNHIDTPHTKSMILGMHQHAHFISPFPKAEELAKLKEVDPRFVELVINSFQKESEHRRTRDWLDFFLTGFIVILGFGTIITATVLGAVYNNPLIYTAAYGTAALFVLLGIIIRARHKSK